MSRDYAHTPRQKNPHSLPGWAWMLGGLVIGLFVALLVYINENTSAANKSRFTETVTSIFNPSDKDKKDAREVRTQTQKAPDKPSQATNKPRFDFYTILPELEVAIPEEELIKSSKQESQQGSQKTQPAQNYILQVGSFKQHTEADKLKANLALQGIVAGIQTVNINGDSWYRVRVGPLSSLATLNQTRKRLQQNGIASIVVKDKK